MITPEEIVKVLNEALAADPVAMYMVGCFTTPVNMELADHPSIQVGPMQNAKASDEGPFMLRFIGLLNGFVSPHGKYIVESWSDRDPEDDHKSRFLGYVVVEASEVTSCPEEYKAEEFLPSLVNAQEAAQQEHEKKRILKTANYLLEELTPILGEWLPKKDEQVEYSYELNKRTGNVSVTIPVKGVLFECTMENTGFGFEHFFHAYYRRRWLGGIRKAKWNFHRYITRSQVIELFQRHQAEDGDWGTIG